MVGTTVPAVGHFSFFQSTATGSSFDVAAFAGVLVVVTGLLLLLSHATTRSVGGSPDATEPRSDPDAASDTDADEPTGSESAEAGDDEAGDDETDDDETDDDETGDDETGDDETGDDTWTADTRTGDTRPVEQERADQPGAATVARSEQYPPWEDADGDGGDGDDGTGESDPLASMGTGMLLANVAATQGIFLVVVAGAAYVTDVPAVALGLSPAAFEPVPLLAGVGLGLGLYVCNEVGAAIADGAGIEYDEHLRTVLAPESASGWAVLLGLVLPLVAVFEETLFRAAMVGVLAAGFGVSPWLLAVGSSLLFAAGHGLQGPAGVVVTGALGFVLAAAFVLSGSLVTVVVAHYLVNALEFAVHEGLGVEWV